MKSFLKKIYRTVFCHGGYGVHSPFAYDLITKVIEERCQYYCYYELSYVRLQILQDDKQLHFSRREHELFFRFANRFKPRNILTVGSDFGLTPLYLTAYSKTSHCTVLESDKTIASFGRKVIKKYANSSIEIHEGDVWELLSKTLKKPVNSCFDFIVWDSMAAGEFTSELFEQFLPNLHDESVIIISDIDKTSNAYKTWKTICNHPKTTVAIDFVNIGVVFFNPKLAKRIYYH